MRNVKIAILISLLLPILSHSGFSNDKITWLTIHWPPFMELDKSRKFIVGGQRGIQLKLLQDELSEYEHINQEMPWSRFWFLVKKGDKICNCMSLKNAEREKIVEAIKAGLDAYITKPFSISTLQQKIENIFNPEQ